MMTTQGMEISFAFAANLDQLVQTGDAGFRLLDGMVVALGRGVNPSPPETRPKPPTAEEIANDAKAAAAHANTEAEIDRLAKQAAADKAEAEAKLAQEAAATLRAYQAKICLRQKKTGK